MRRPEELKPDRLIKFAYLTKEEQLRFSTAYTVEKAKRSWKDVLRFKKPRVETYVDAHLLDRYNTLVIWNQILAWDYVDFKSLFDKLPNWYKKKLAEGIKEEEPNILV